MAGRNTPGFDPRERGERLACGLFDVPEWAGPGRQAEGASSQQVSRGGKRHLAKKINEKLQRQQNVLYVIMRFLLTEFFSRAPGSVLSPRTWPNSGPSEVGTWRCASFPSSRTPASTPSKCTRFEPVVRVRTKTDDRARLAGPRTSGRGLESVVGCWL